jgi:hypothetical protein
VWGEGRQGVQWELALSKGPARMGICHHHEGTAFPSKGSFFSFSYLNMHPTHHYNVYLCVLVKKRLSVQVKNIPSVGI